MRRLERYDKNGTPVVMLFDFYYKGKKGIKACFARRRFKNMYKSESEINKDIEILIERGLIKENPI